LEDITRADYYGFVVPFVTELMRLSEDSGIKIKVRACDTLGYGVTYPGSALPRSVQGIIYGLNHYAGVPSEQIEWHGHNDFYKVVTNAATAWLYGCSGVNCSAARNRGAHGQLPGGGDVHRVCVPAGNGKRNAASGHYGNCRVLRA